MAKYYIGIDWGKSKCGIALADEENRIATGYKTVPKGDFLVELEKINKDNPIRKVIVGQLRESDLAAEMEKFTELVRKEGFETEMENEDFSSVMAQANLKELGGKGISARDDTEAARIILQSWLDRR